MNGNIHAVRLLIESLSRKDRAALLSELQPATAPAAARAPRVYSPAKTAELMGRSKRLVFKLSREGLLRRVTLPGRKRAIGFDASSVERLIAGGGDGA